MKRDDKKHAAFLRELKTLLESYDAELFAEANLNESIVSSSVGLTLGVNIPDAGLYLIREESSKYYALGGVTSQVLENSLEELEDSL